MATFPNIPDPMLALSARARRQLCRFVTGVDGGFDASAARELESRDLICFANPVMRDGFPVTEKGRAVWEASK